MLCNCGFDTKVAVGVLQLFGVLQLCLSSFSIKLPIGCRIQPGCASCSQTFDIVLTEHKVGTSYTFHRPACLWAVVFTPSICPRNAKEETMCCHCCVQGVAGSRPAANHLMAALQQHDLFLYFGHGAAEQCLPLSALRRLDSCAAALLMGCSSGRLRSAGQYEAAGPVWSYLMAGEPSWPACSGSAVA